MKLFEYLFILVNLVTFITFGIDKYLARTNRDRVSEKTLLSLCVMGGSVGAIMAQSFFRHKTKKFKYIVWIIFFLQIISFWLFLWNSGQK